MCKVYSKEMDKQASREWSEVEVFLELVKVGKVLFNYLYVYLV